MCREHQLGGGSPVAGDFCERIAHALVRLAVRASAFRDRAARLAHAAGIDRRPALPVRADAVERLGYQPGLTWIPWILPMVAGSAAAVAVAGYLGRVRTKRDTQRLTAALKT